MARSHDWRVIERRGFGETIFATRPGVKLYENEQAGIMCDCREAVNERLAVSNAKIGEGLMFGDSRIDLAPPMILLEKIDKGRRTRLPTLLATCCPFCGERYKEDDPGKPVPPHGPGPDDQ